MLSRNPNHWWLALAMWALLAAGGCTVFSAADKAVVDHRAAVMNAVADKANAMPAPPSTEDWMNIVQVIERERRAAVNLSNTAHWEKPTYKYNPKTPTTLPWKPVDDAPTVQP